MAERNAVIVDLSNLNVVFKLGTTFVLTLNYSSGVDRLAEMLPSLGPGYDIYLCLKPRFEGEGDIVIDELSLAGLPCVADSDELYTVLKFFRDSSGVSDVYLCNWVANYIAVARVATFTSVFYYGERVAMLKVKDRLPESFSCFDNQLQFTETVGDDFDGYGDLGLLDIDGIKAQYPELSGGSKAQLTAIAPLVQCYRTPIKLDTEELFGRLEVKRREKLDVLPTPPVKDDVILAVEDPQIAVASEELPEPPVPSAPGKSVKESLHFRKTPTPLLAKLLVGVSLVLAFGVGACAHTVFSAKTPALHEEFYAQADARISGLQQLAVVYTSAYNTLKGATSAFDYCQSSDLGVSIAGFEYTLDNIVVRCACASEDISSAFTNYIAEKYTVISTNDLGMTEVDGQTVYQFSVMFS